MFSNTMRHWVVALGLVAVAGVTAASGAGFGHATRQAPPAARASLPAVSGDLGEVVVYAPGDLGEVIVRAPHDLGEVLVTVGRTPLEGAYMAEVVVTAPRDGGAGITDGAAATLAAVR
jgi:hypothetical protein